MTVLDVGCGCMPHAKGEEVIGIDILRTNLEEVKHQLSCIVADATKLPLRSHTFHSVIMSDVLEHLENPQACLKEVKRTCKNRSVVVVEIPNGHSLEEWSNRFFGFLKWSVYEHVHRFSEADMVNLMSGAGFKVTHVERQYFLTTLLVSIYFHVRKMTSTSPTRDTQKFQADLYRSPGIFLSTFVGIMDNIDNHIVARVPALVAHIRFKLRPTL